MKTLANFENSQLGYFYATRGKYEKNGYLLYIHREEVDDKAGSYFMKPM
jgi:hypothetical protein